MDEFTKEQKAQLKTWAEQRDDLLSEISILRINEERLRVVNKDLSNSNSDIQVSIGELRGRIEELKIKESELPGIISKEVSSLESEKTALETEISSFNKIITILKTQKSSLENDVEKELYTFKVIKGEALLLDKVVDRVTDVSKRNSDKIDLLVLDLARSLEEIIAVNKKNVLETNIVIAKVPKMIMECQKHGLINKKI